MIYCPSTPLIPQSKFCQALSASVLLAFLGMSHTQDEKNCLVRCSSDIAWRTLVKHAKQRFDGIGGVYKVTYYLPIYYQRHYLVKSWSERLSFQQSIELLIEVTWIAFMEYGMYSPKKNPHHNIHFSIVAVYLLYILQTSWSVHSVYTATILPYTVSLLHFGLGPKLLVQVTCGRLLIQEIL